ncbi:hypothetical protein BD779DRAFT_1548037 [Infundibulicybe gibba]|nr:hypothetical protein BD779DRAFT_1548037 [Infundibulicybe gibba]
MAHKPWWLFTCPRYAVAGSDRLAALQSQLMRGYSTLVREARTLASGKSLCNFPFVGIDDVPAPIAYPWNPPNRSVESRYNPVLMLKSQPCTGKKFDVALPVPCSLGRHPRRSETSFSVLPPIGHLHLSKLSSFAIVVRQTSSTYKVHIRATGKPHFCDLTGTNLLQPC